jgi:aminoglycoside phosphotransferase (APT) family kinase protein
VNLADALSGRAKLQGIQWLLLSATSRRALRDQLKALLPAPNMLGPCRLRRVRLRTGRKLTAYYDARVRVEGTEAYHVRPIAVTWTLDGDADRRQGRDDLAGMQAEALRHGVAAPFLQLTAELPEWSMHVQVSPLDAQFPQLVRLLDLRHGRDMLAAAYAASGAAPDQPRPDGYAVTSIRYCPGNRHVLRYDPLDAAKGRAVFAKLYTGEEGAHAFRVAKDVADWLAEHGEGVTSVRPLAYVAEDRVVLYPELSGAALSEHLRRPGEGVARCLERAGAALHALHRLPQAVASPLQPLDFTAEVRKTGRGRNHIPALLPSVGAAISALLDRAQELHERLPQEPPTFTHGDFKCDHVWAAPGGPTLIDFDSCRLADPAFDVGRFLAHVQLWYATYDQPGLEQAQERFLAGYARGAPEERLVRARLYEVVQLVKITRRVPLFDHDWASRTEQLIRRAWTVMNDLELVLGLPATHYRCGGPHDLSERGNQP